MKTNFPQRNNRSRNFRSRKREVLIVALVFVFGGLGYTIVGRYASVGLAPLWHSNFFLRSGASNLVGSLRSKDALVAENSALKERLASDEDLITSLRSIASSRDELLASFGRVPEHAIPASVLVHPPETPYDILIIDAGEDLGVVSGSLVSTPDGTLVGSISDVFSKSARVKLYSTAGMRTDAILERGSAGITLIGRGGGNFEFTLPRDAEVEVGDRIVSPYLSASLVGVVGAVQATPTDSFKTVYVRSPVEPTNVRYVLIKQ